MPVCNIITTQMSQEQKALLSKDFGDILVSTINANLQDVKIIFNCYDLSDISIGGVMCDKMANPVLFQAIIYLIAGRTQEQLRACVAQLAASAQKMFGYESKTIRILLSEMSKNMYSSGGVFISDQGGSK